jgi:signal transduction histidine kinase
MEGRALTETVDIPARIAELRSVLLETRSDDLRKAIQAAIEDCRRKLGQVDHDHASRELPRLDPHQQSFG